jgi:hypothetical protein
MQYFSSRAAPMGPVAAEVVIATFFNFHPALITRSIPAAWDIAAPEAITVARLAGIDGALRRILGDAVGSPEMAEAAELARRAALRAAEHPDGRALFAGHAPTRDSFGPTSRTSCCGTPSRCCANTAATGTSPRSSSKD